MKHLENSVTQIKSQNNRPSPPHTRSAETPRFPLEFVKLRASLFRWNRVDPRLQSPTPIMAPADKLSRSITLKGGGGGGKGRDKDI